MLLAVAGALSMMAQVVVLRELVAALYGVELLYVLALGSWLVGTAIGAAAGRHVPATAGRGFAGCLLLALVVPAEVVLIRAAGPAAGTVAGAYLPFPAQLAWIAASTVPPAAICGLLFPVLAGLAGTQGRTVGRSYAVESAGAAAAGAGVTLAMGLGASTFQVALAAPAVGAVAALSAASSWSRRRRVVLACCAVLAAAVLVTRAHPWDLALLRRMYPALVDAADTPYARVVVSRHDLQAAVFENGALAFDTEGTSAEAFADLAAVQHPQPRRVLVIGGGGEGVPDALARHGVPQIDNLEIDRRAFELVRRYAAAASDRATTAGRVSVRFEEPRQHLEHAEPYDLILVAAGEPASGASSRFYTREFFAQCARRLTRGGVVALRLAAAENVWPRPLARRTASIVAALRGEFGHLELVAGETLYLFASDSPLSADPDLLAGRLLGRGVHPRLITPAYIEYLYTNDRRDEVARLLEATPVDGPNRDDAPVCYQYAAMIWLSRFYPGLAAASGGRVRVQAWQIWGAIAVLAAGAVTWARRRHNRRVGLCLVVVGFIGMVLETVLLLRYQIRNGVVYQQVGWLLTCFMTGVTAGGYTAGGLPGANGPDRLLGGRLAIPLAALAVSVGAFAAIAWLPSAAGLAGTSLLLAAAGAAVGGAFAVAARIWQGHAPGAAASLYAADVAGGAIGAVAATLVLVPAAGLDRSALLTAALAASLFAVIPRSGSGGR
jgi:spermidine synthase